MQTPWGEIEVSDAHVHFFSRAFFASLASQRAAQGLGPATETAESIAAIAGWQAPPVDPQALAAIWVRELDRHGVRRAALIASIPGDENSVAEAVRRFPDRFYGYFMVNPMAPGALESVEGALAAGLRGFCFFPAMHRYSMNDAHVEPILQAVSTRTGVVIFVHCGILTVGIRG